MDAIILAAGYATRLYPLTLNTPKPLLSVGGKPILERIIEKLSEVDEIDNIHVVTNNKFYDHFVEWRRKFPSTKNIHVINDGTLSNEDRLGALGDIKFTLEKQNINDDVLIIAGDNLFEFSLKDFVKSHKEHGSSLVAFYDLKDPMKLANKFGVGIIDENKRVINFEEKPEQPKSSLASTGCYVYDKEAIQILKDGIGDEHFNDNSGNFIVHLLDVSKVHAYVFDEGWFDIGSHEDFKEADRIYSS